MAIFHFTQQYVSRSTGRSAIAGWAYITASKMKNERTGEIHDFRSKKGVVCSAMILPDQAPEWVKDGERFWNELALFEDQLGTERYKNPHSRTKILGSVIEGISQEASLPLELTVEQNKALVEDYIAKNITSRGLVCGYGIHWEEGNPHVHIMICERKINAEGEFSRCKEKELQKKSFLRVSREIWATIQNHHLEKHGYDVRVDHRSHKDRGLEILPTMHEGWSARDGASRGKVMDRTRLNQEIKAHNASLIAQAPEQILKEISTLKATFKEQDLARLIFARVQGDEALYDVVYQGVRGSKDLVRIGTDIAGKDVFTTAQYQASEKNLAKLAQEMTHNRNINRKLNRAVRTSYVKGLSSEQQKAVAHLCGKESLSLLIGRAGSGKTTTLRPVAEFYQRAGYRVRGMALAGAAAEILGQEIGLDSRSIASWQWAWDEYDKLRAELPHIKNSHKKNIALKKLETLGAMQLTDRDVIILDEIGMVGVRDLEEILAKAKTAGAKVIGAGDNHQFGAIEAGDALRTLLAQVKAAELKEIVRQKEPWMRAASKKFAELQTAEGLDAYNKNGLIHWNETAADSHQSLIADYLKDRETSPLKSRVIMAYTNEEVDALNALVREELKRQGLIGDSLRSAKTPNQASSLTIGKKEYVLGERIVFLDNDNHGKKVQTLEGNYKGVKNSTLGTIIGFENGEIQVQIDTHASREKKVVSFDPTEYRGFEYGYAVNAYKSQGATVDQVYVLFSKYLNAYSLYVVMTRHREKVKAYTNYETFEDYADLVRKLSRIQQKDLVFDYTITEENHPYWQKIQDYKELSFELSALREQLSEKENKSQAEKLIEWNGYQALKEEQKGLAKSIIRHWDKHALYANQSNISREVLEVQAGLRARRLSDAEKRAQDRVELYAGSVTTARDLWNEIKATHPGALSRQHERFTEFENLRADRDSLANAIIENSRLHRPFIQQYGGNWKAIKSQSEAHYKRGLEKSYYGRLSAQEKAYYDDVCAYKESSHLCSQVWKELQEQNKLNTANPNANPNSASPDRALKPWENERFDEWKKLRDQRDERAARIAGNPASYQTYLDRLVINEETLKKQAQTHELRQLALTYKDTQSALYKEMLADEITARLNHLTKLSLDKGENKKGHYGILFEEGINYRELALNAQLYQVKQQVKEAPNASRSTYLKKLSGLYKSSSNDYKNYRAEVVNRLNGYTREIAIELLGSPNQHMSNARELRFGKKGKLRVTLQGSSVGSWNDWSTGEGGGLLKLIEREKGLRPKEALNYAAVRIGMSPWQGRRYEIDPQEQRKRENQKAIDNAFREKQQQEEEARKIERVQKLYEGSQKIEGTLAERYLREHRGIQAQLPESLRFHPGVYESQTKEKHPALVAFAKDHEGEIKAAQVTYLNPITAHKADLETKKRSQGMVKGSFVEIQKGQGPIYVAEGVETALSIKEAGVEGSIFASLGISNIRNLNLEYATINNSGGVNSSIKSVIVCADNDAFGSGTHKLIAKSVQDLQDKGYNVGVIRPEQEGRDFNDVLKQEGALKVKEYLNEVHANKKSLEQPSLQTELSSSQSRNASQETQSLEANFTKDNAEKKSAVLNTQMVQEYLVDRYVALNQQCKSLPNLLDCTPDQRKELQSYYQEIQKTAYEIHQDQSLSKKVSDLKLDQQIKSNAEFYRAKIEKELEQGSPVIRRDNFEQKDFYQYEDHALKKPVPSLSKAAPEEDLLEKWKQEYESHFPEKAAEFKKSVAQSATDTASPVRQLEILMHRVEISKDTPMHEKAQRELEAYAKALTQDESSFGRLLVQNKELAERVKEIAKTQEVHSRGMSFEL